MFSFFFIIINCDILLTDWLLLVERFMVNLKFTVTKLSLGWLEISGIIVYLCHINVIYLHLLTLLELDITELLMAWLSLGKITCWKCALCIPF